MVEREGDIGSLQKGCEGIWQRNDRGVRSLLQKLMMKQ